MTATGCMVSGVMDTEFVRGLGKLLRKDKYTYSEDALRTLVQFVFEKIPAVSRIETNVLIKNKLGLKLVERAGFKKEGVLRQYLQIDDVLEDVAVYSILRNEHVIRTAETTNHLDTGVSETSTRSL